MLSHLSIQNLVLIEKAEIHPGGGLCVLSGETGAGKSILLDALGLALGGRSEARLVRKGAEKAQVAATFEIGTHDGIAALMEELGLEPAEEIIIRRQLTADGKSKAFINDEPVSVKALKDLGEALVEIHGQHQQRGLLDSAQHLALLDAYGQLSKERAKVAEAHAAWKAVERSLSELLETLNQAAREREYLEHMQQELASLSPEAGEEERLAEARTRMMQSEKMAQTIDDALAALTQPRSISEALRSAERVLTRSTLAEAPKFSTALAALDKAGIELQEAISQLEALGTECGYDQGELERSEERLFALRAAARKYQCSVDELPTRLADVNARLGALNTGEKNRAQLEKDLAITREAYVQAATALRKAREKAGGRLEESVLKELKPLKMEATRFRVAMTPKDEAQWGANGMDAVRFEVATNKGSDFGALAAIASGGELSRFMLALAVVLGEVDATPVLIFDEIDTGTGGAVADAIGKRLERLGQHAQVLVVTHQPQVAARGRTHFFIEKKSKGETTTTQVRALDDAGRREELARMLSGAAITEEARKAADRLMEDTRVNAA
jgi:DNA repair protein RecN (Recombination protein N)